MTVFTFPIRVYYEDTDAGGVVYYANYFKFAERARTEWLRSLGFEQEKLRREKGMMFVVARVEVDYKAPAHLDDWLTVESTLHAIGKVHMTMHQTIWRGHKALTGFMVKLVCIDANGKPIKIPDKLATALAGGMVKP